MPSIEHNAAELWMSINESLISDKCNPILESVTIKPFSKYDWAQVEDASLESSPMGLNVEARASVTIRAQV